MIVILRLLVKMIGNNICEQKRYITSLLFHLVMNRALIAVKAMLLSREFHLFNFPTFSLEE